MKSACIRTRPSWPMSQISKRGLRALLRQHRHLQTTHFLVWEEWPGLLARLLAWMHDALKLTPRPEAITAPAIAVARIRLPLRVSESLWLCMSVVRGPVLRRTPHLGRIREGNKVYGLGRCDACTGLRPRMERKDPK